MSVPLYPRYETDAQQNLDEHDAFVALLIRENVRSYLEIGSKYGGSLWRVRRALPMGSLMASVDRPHDEAGRASLLACVERLRELGYDARHYFGDSTSEGAVLWAQSMAPFDCVFVDANHALPWLDRDWKNYAPMARMIALHDVNHTRPVPKGRNPIDVAPFWKRLKESRLRTWEITLDADCNGIGVAWVSATS